MQWRLILSLLFVDASTALVLKNENEGLPFMYDYSKHGQEWSQGTCSSRTRQSPIDFPPILNAVPTAKFQFSYQRIGDPYVLSNNGHTLSMSLRNQGYGGLNYEDAWHDLMYVNVHAMSEHTFQGVHHPVEVHLVHKRYDSDALIIVAIPVTSAAPPPAGGNPLPGPGAQYTRPNVAETNFNPTLQAFLMSPLPPPMMKQQVPGNAVNGPDLSEFLKGANFLEYAGSTTAPPCSENVLWLVRSAPILAADTQVRYLYDLMYRSTYGYGNFRATMPLEGRPIQLRMAIMEPSPIMGMRNLPAGATASTKADGEYRSLKWAKDALTVSTAALDYVRNLDQRLHSASAKSAADMAPYLVNFGPAPGPAPAPAPCPVTPTDQAAAMVAATIAQAANAAIQNATVQISEQAMKAAMASAQQATQVVMRGLPELPHPTHLPPIVAVAPPPPR